MNKILVSSEIPEIVYNLQKLGYEVITTNVVEEFLFFEKHHADMQCLKIKDTYFVLKNCKRLSDALNKQGLNVIETALYAGEKYPNNVLLNCIYLNDKLYCKKSAVDKNVAEFCKRNKIEIVNVNQGYAKCSTAIIDNKFITADKSIYSALTKDGVEGILITPGDINLNGVNYGFIGGCCFSYENTVYFTGDVTKHRDYKKIANFCHCNNKNIMYLSKEKLYDIGGFVLL